MENVHAKKNDYLTQLKDLKQRIGNLATRMNTFEKKYRELTELIVKTDGGVNKIPNAIKSIDGKYNGVKSFITKTLSTSFDDIESLNMGIPSCELFCDVLCRQYESTMDELISLYSKKYQALEKAQALPENVINNTNLNNLNNENVRENNGNYKNEAMRIINLYKTFGVIDERLITKTTRRKKKYDKKAEECLTNLDYVINNTSYGSISAIDITKIKEILSKIDRMDTFNDETKDREYEAIEEYIAKIAGRDMRATRNANESTSDKRIDNKLGAMEVLGLYNKYEVTPENLLKIAQVDEDSLDDAAKAYLENLAETISTLSPSEMLNKDAEKIKEVVVQLGQINTLDEDAKKRAYENIDEFILELSKRKGRSK